MGFLNASFIAIIATPIPIACCPNWIDISAKVVNKDIPTASRTLPPVANASPIAAPKPANTATCPCVNIFFTCC